MNTINLFGGTGQLFGVLKSMHPLRTEHLMRPMQVFLAINICALSLAVSAQTPPVSAPPITSPTQASPTPIPPIPPSASVNVPWVNAIKMVHGNGERLIVTFEDPNCGYCRQLATELSVINNVTIYTFILPILGERSQIRAKNIWCSPNREEAWTRWMLSRVEPKFNNCDASALKANLALAERLKIRGTPKIIFKNGQQISGYVSASKIESVLNSIK